jgi:hypothetical protein
MAYRIARKAQGIAKPGVESPIAWNAIGIPKTEVEWLNRLKKKRKKRAASKYKEPARAYQSNRQPSGDLAHATFVPTATMDDDEPTRRWYRSSQMVFDRPTMGRDTPRPIVTARPTRVSLGQLLARLNQVRESKEVASRKEDAALCLMTRPISASPPTEGIPRMMTRPTQVVPPKEATRPVRQTIKTWPYPPTSQRPPKPFEYGDKK